MTDNVTGSAKIAIFNTRLRSLGQGGRSVVYAQVDVSFRGDLYHLKGAALAVFLAIALHTNEDGWSWPSYDRLMSETGYTRNTVRKALGRLCKLQIDGRRLLLRYQPRRKARPIDNKGRGGGGRFDSNRYLIFPSKEELRRYEGRGIQHLGAKTGGGFDDRPEADGDEPWCKKRATVERATVERSTKECTTNNNQHEPEPTLVDWLVNGLTELGFNPPHVAEAYAQEHPDLAKGWLDVIDTPAFAWVDNPAGYVRAQLDKGVTAPVLLESGTERNPDYIPALEPEFDGDDVSDVGEVSPAMQEARRAWSEVKYDFSFTMSRDTFNAWLKPTTVSSFEGDRLIIAARSQAAQWLHHRLRGDVERALLTALGREVEVEFVGVGEDDG